MDEWEHFKQLDNLWSLFTLCLLRVTIDPPIKFVHNYNRWVQFHYTNDKEKVEKLFKADLSKEIPQDFWVSLARLVASRNFEKSCMLLRQLMLDRSYFGLKYQGQIELLLERMLEAPSPSMTCQDPSLLEEFVSGNRQIFQSESMLWPFEMMPLIKILEGNVHVVRDLLSWQEVLGSTLLFSCLPNSYEEITLKAQELYGRKNGTTIDRLSLALLHFNPDIFLATLEQEDFQDPYLLLIVCHMVDLLAKVGKFHDESIPRKFFCTFAKRIFNFDRGLWKLGIYYGITCCKMGENIIDEIISKIDLESVVEALNIFGTDMRVLKNCRLYLRLQSKSVMSISPSQAYHWADLAKDEITKNRIVYRVLQLYTDTEDVKYLEMIREPDVVVQRILSSLISFHHLLKEADTFEPKDCLLAIETILGETGPLPEALIVKLLRVWASLSTNVPSSRQLLLKIMEILDQDFKSIPLELCKIIRIRIMQESVPE